MPGKGRLTHIRPGDTVEAPGGSTGIAMRKHVIPPADSPDGHYRLDFMVRFADGTERWIPARELKFIRHPLARSL